MGEVVSITRAQLDRIDTAENQVRQILSRRLDAMNITDSERAIALNVALYRARNGTDPSAAIAEGQHYAKLREQERNAEWRRLAGDKFVASDYPDGVA